jgi:phosphatidylserine/phosphatidylglycerophosphate/cardiolipin synthase-like enzyme
VSDSDYANRDAVRSCIAAGIPVVFDEREAFMHNKFCVVDEARVWTGSTNISENEMYRNNNNAVLIASSKLAGDFGSEFEEMFVSKKFGKSSPRKTPFPEVAIDGTRVECYFAPEDHVLREIMDEVAGAIEAIDIMAFAFTSTDLAKAVVKRIEHGVAVRGLFDTRGAGSEYSRDDYLAEHGARVFLDQNPYTMHNKVIIIDSDTVITGSYNFTQSAETKNDENALIIHSPAIAGRYRAEFESLLPQ